MTQKEQRQKARRSIEAYRPQDEKEAVEKQVILRAMDSFENILTRESALAHLTSSSWIVNPSRDKALMVYHNIYRSWSWTGGHADGEGDLLAVALREAREETGAEVRSLSEEILSVDILTVKRHVKRGNYVSAHLHLSVCYLFEAPEDCALTVRPDENSGVCWIPFSQIAEKVKEPEMLPVYQKLMERAARQGL